VCFKCITSSWYWKILRLKISRRVIYPKTSSLQTIWKTGTENSRWHKPSPVRAPNTEVKEGVVCFAYWCIVLRDLTWVEQRTRSFKEFMPQKGQYVNVRLYYKPNFWPGLTLFRVFHCDACRSSWLFHWRSILGWNVSEKVPKLMLSSRLGVGRWKVCM